MNLNWILTLAQNKTDPPSLVKMLDPRNNPMMLMVLLLVVFYIFVIRSKQKQEKAARARLGQARKGDKVQMAGGIIGKIVELRDNEVVVKVDETTNTKLVFVRDAISKVLESDEKPTAGK